MTEQSPSTFFSLQAMRSAPWMVLGKGLTFFIYFAISVAIVRGLTPHQYGEYSLCKAIAEYLTKVGLIGLNFTLLRFIPELVIAHNLAGIKRLLTRTAALQLGLLTLLVGLLGFFQGEISAWLKIDLHTYLGLIFLVVLATAIRNFGNDVSTALYQSRFIALISLGHALIWLALLTLFLRAGWGVAGVLLSMALAGIVAGASNILRLWTHFAGLHWQSPPRGIGRSRVFWLAIPVLINDLVNLMIMSYTEIFFLGIFFTPTIVGYYDLGYQLPLLAITFIPLALQSLFTSAFAESYSKDPSCLPNLVYGYFQMLIVISVPIACFGAVHASSIVSVLYGAKMLPAVPVISFFALFHLAAQFSIPPSMAINAMEKTVSTLWFGLLELGLAIVLDFLLIRHWGLWGAMAAVLSAFLLTLPIRVRMIRQLVGGIYFPVGFFVRIFALCLGAAFLSAYVIPKASIAYLAAALLCYVILILAGARLLHLVTHRDVVRFRSVNLKPLNRLLDFFVR